MDSGKAGISEENLEEELPPDSKKYPFMSGQKMLLKKTFNGKQPKFFDSGEYELSKQAMERSKKSKKVPSPLNTHARGNVIPTLETVATCKVPAMPPHKQFNNKKD